MKTRMFVICQGEYIYPTLYETKEDASLKIKNIESNKFELPNFEIIEVEIYIPFPDPRKTILKHDHKF